MEYNYYMIFGLILLFIPFILVLLFKDQKKGFLCVLLSLCVFHICLAFFAQLMGVFYYTVIIWCVCLVDLGILAFYVLKISKQGFKMPKIDWMALIVLAICAVTLYQVNYNYTGKISLTRDGNEYHEVKNMQYAYPYFSDEWYSIAFIKDSITSGSLPLVNPLNPEFFPNLEMFSHIFLAQIVLLLGLNPLTQYVALSIGVNTLIILLAYLFLRANDVPKLSSAIAALSMLYITSAANLPGIWNLIPITLGIFFIIIGFCFVAYDDIWPAVAAFCVASLFYPLLLPWYGLGTFIWLLPKLKIQQEKLFYMAGYLALSLFIGIPAILVVWFASPWSNILSYIFSKLFYPSYSGALIPQFNIFYIILWPVIILACIALPFLYKHKKWLFWQLALGVFYWILYFFISWRIIIEFERIVLFTSILICLTAGFGLKSLQDYIHNRYKKETIFKYAQILMIMVFVMLIPFYTNLFNWQKLILLSPDQALMAYPKAPANNYLIDDDLKIFSGINKKRFLSVPWKGTVVGVTTGNYPVVTKQGTISMGSQALIDSFISSNCSDKISIARSWQIDYIYLYEFSCPNFKKMGQSSEGFILYNVD